jgi:hypothetical protein
VEKTGYESGWEGFKGIGADTVGEEREMEEEIDHEGGREGYEGLGTSDVEEMGEETCGIIA